MRCIKQDKGLVAEFHIGVDRKRVVLTISVTNTSTDVVRTKSGMGSWADLYLSDTDNNVPRLESRGSVAALTSWKIEPGKSMVDQRKTETEDEVLDEWSDIDLPRLETTTDPEAEHNENVHFVSNLNLPEDNGVELKGMARVHLEGYDFGELEINFCPRDVVEDPMDPEVTYDLTERDEISF